MGRCCQQGQLTQPQPSDALAPAIPADPVQLEPSDEPEQPKWWVGDSHKHCSMTCVCVDRPRSPASPTQH